jgi:hypothetical protein
VFHPHSTLSLIIHEHVTNLFFFVTRWSTVIVVAIRMQQAGCLTIGLLDAST